MAAQRPRAEAPGLSPTPAFHNNKSGPSHANRSASQAVRDGWGGDEYIVFYDDQNSAIVLVMHTSWETVNEATQFYNAFQKHSTTRSGAPVNLQVDRIGWSHDDGYTELSTQNLFTTWILAPDEEMAE